MLDNSCAAQLQGPDRMTRGATYNMYLGISFGDAAKKMQSFITLPKIGYDPAPLFGSQCAMAALFGEGMCQ